MRRPFIVAGVAIALLVAAGIAGGGFFLLRSGAALDAEAKAYVDDAVVAFTAHWSADELLQRASPRFLEVTKPDDLRAFVDAAGKGLGPLVQYKGATGGSLVSVNPTSGTTISARFLAHAKYERGDAALSLILLKEDGTWKIAGFHIDSNAMIANLARQPR